MFAVLDVPFKLAVTVAVEFELIAPAVAVKFAELAFAATLTEVGTVSVLLLEASETVVAPLGVELDNDTVHVLVPLVTKLAGEHRTEVTLIGASKLMLAVEEAPLRVAVIVALPLEVIIPVVAAKLVERTLAAIDTEAGTAKAASDEIDIVLDPLRKTFERVTMQEVLVFETRLAGAHCNPERVTGA